MIRISTPLLFLATVSLLIATSCKKEEKKPQTPAPQAPVINNPGNNDKLPVVTTYSVFSHNETDAFIACKVVSAGADTIVEAGICWDTLPAPTTLKLRQTAGMFKVGPYYAWLWNFKLGKTFYIRSYARNTYGTSYGNEISINIPK